MLDCPVTETRLKPIGQKPVLSIVIPTWNRVPEMVMAVESLASQITDGLEDKVEIIITDNASGYEGQSAIRALSDRFGSVSYIFHEKNESAAFQLFAACWRSRGEWTWTFGSDDLLLPGGLAHIVAKLENEQPGFLSLNHRTYTADLTRELYVPLVLPDRTFDNFADLLCGVGFHQVSYITACLERTSLARGIEPLKYLKMDLMFPQLLGYLEKHKNSKSVYWHKDYVVNRQHNSQLYKVDHLVQRDIGWKTPIAIMEKRDLYSISEDFFEKINGDDRVERFYPPILTFVDVMFKSALLAISNDHFLTLGEEISMIDIIKNCRPHRLGQFKKICELNREMADSYADIDRTRDDLYKQKRIYDAKMETIRMSGRQWKKNQTC